VTKATVHSSRATLPTSSGASGAPSSLSSMTNSLPSSSSKLKKKKTRGKIIVNEQRILNQIRAGLLRSLTKANKEVFT
jgi:hypothetical protein